MNRVAAALKNPAVIAAAVILVLGGVGWWALSGDDTAEPLSAPSADASTAAPVPTESESPTPSPTASVDCEDDDTLFNQDGEQASSLLPDCDEQQPVSEAEEAKSGLGLGCGGKYPVILYKTESGPWKSSICGADSSGADLRVVVKRDGSAALDLDGEYDYTIDGFVAEDGDATYRVIAYNGSIERELDGQTTSTGPGDWMSLDNEPDYD